MSGFSSERNFVFDFDGTIYPGNLLLDGAFRYFFESKQQDRLELLTALANSKKEKTLPELLYDFSIIVSGANKRHFDKICFSLIDRCYSHFGKFISIAKKQGVRTYLCSFTSKEIAQKLKSKYGFDEIFWFDYPLKISENEVLLDCFNEEILVLDPIAYKLAAVTGRINRVDVMFGNGVEDSGLMQAATLGVGVNPDSNLRELSLVVKSKEPWKELCAPSNLSFLGLEPSFG